MRSRSIRLPLLAVALVSAALAMPATVAAADEPNGAASCMGIEHASISPPGTSEEEPGGSRQFVEEVRGLAAGAGVPVGTLFASIAKLHEGSHEACDEALGGGEDEAAEAAGAVRASTFGLHARDRFVRAWPKAL